MKLDEHPHLARARERSVALIARLRECLDALPAVAPEVVTVAASGSIGRLEALPGSDCDLIVVVADGTPIERARAVMATISEVLAPLALPASRPGGIYAAPAAAAALLDPHTRGRVADDVDVFGKRIQLLLDARPLFGDEAFAALRRAVLERYAQGFVERDPGSEWFYLLADLERYFASYRVSKLWDFARDNGGWYLRSAKVGHSRVLMHAGLLFLLGDGSRERADQVARLLAQLPMTPLERVAHVYEVNGDANFGRVARCYDRFLGLLGDETVRRALIEAAPARADLLAPERVPAYLELQRNSGRMVDELIRFVLERRREWSAQFFRYLIL